MPTVPTVGQRELLLHTEGLLGGPVGAAGRFRFEIGLAPQPGDFLKKPTRQLVLRVALIVAIKIIRNVDRRADLQRGRRACPLTEVLADVARDL